jgi:hypothetical protein
MATKKHAQKTVDQIEFILANNDNFVLVRRSYVGALQAVADSLKRRLAKGEFINPSKDLIF